MQKTKTITMGGFMTEEQKRNEAARLKDAEILARRKKKFDAARFDHIDSNNQIHGAPKEHAPKEDRDWKKESETKLEEEKKRGWRIFKKKDKNSANELLKESTDPKYQLEPPPPIAAKSEKPDGIPVEMAPNWAGVDQQNQRPHPNYGHSSDVSFPKLPMAAKLPTHVPVKARPKPDPNKPMYDTVGYGAKGVKADGNISSTIAAFQKGFKPITGKPRNMKKEKVVSSQSETMDNKGNITRTITKKITDPNTGKTRTETEVIKMPAKKK